MNPRRIIGQSDFLPASTPALEERISTRLRICIRAGEASSGCGRVSGTSRPTGRAAGPVRGTRWVTGRISVRPCACRQRLPVCALPWTDPLASERLLPPLLSAPAGPNSGKASVGRSAKHPTVRLYDTAHQLSPRTNALKDGLLSGAREILDGPLRRRPHPSAIIAWGSNVQPVFAKPDLDSAGCSSGMLLTGNVCCNDSGV